MKKLLLSLLMVGASFAASAQTNDANDVTYASQKCKNNIFISIGVGAQGLINVDNLDYGFFKSIKPLYTISAGKMFTPKWGVRAQFSGYQTKLYSDYNRINNTAQGRDEYQKFHRDYVSFNADFVANLTTLLRGYDPSHKFDLFVFLGPGMSFGKFHDDDIRVKINGSAGLIAKYYLNDKWSLDLDARATMMPTFYPEQRTYQDGIIGVTLGATYTFGGRTFQKYVNANYADDQYAALKRANDKLAEDNAAFRQEMERLLAQKPTKEIVKEVSVETPRAAVNFAFNSSKITNVEELTIKLWAEFLKEYKDVKISLTGFADKYGTKMVNKRISERRAENVRNMFVEKYGIDADRIEVASEGHQPIFGNNHDWNRCVIIQVVK
jgi:outer membrane protein OmpA-like peptidoglycan-associated protein